MKYLGTITNDRDLPTKAYVDSRIASPIRPNLLDNWYFAGGGSQQGGGQLPINTKGQTSYSGANTDTIDGWGLVGAHTVNIVPAGLKLTVSSSAAVSFMLKQIVGNLDTGLTYTLSALIVENTTTTGAVVRFDSSVSTPLLGTGLISYTFQPASDSIGLGVYSKANDNDSYFVVAAMKLEIGDTQTLAHQEDGAWVLNEIPDYNVQMLRCAKGVSPFAQIETGSYVGTGTSGSSNKSSLTFGAKPKLIMIRPASSSGYFADLLYGASTSQARYGSTSTPMTLTWSNNTVQWYASSAVNQLNDSGKTYLYTAVF